MEEKKEPMDGAQGTGDESREAVVDKNLGKVFSSEIESEMKVAFLDYAMSVIISRALPDIRDGLKPVHRRILYSMHESGFHFNKPYKKSARIVGDVLGRYHPHGDSAVYDSLVRMAQSFSMRYPLIDGQGNFGSVDGDSAAAMRYTEARLAKVSSQILEDIDKNTVDFSPNFDGSLSEPTVLPSKLPSLLLNGSSGIAVGMATNIPPHNLRELGSAIIAFIKDPEMTTEEILEHIPAPDFPTGGTIIGKKGILSAYKTGKGIIKIRSNTRIESEGEKEKIIVDEIPYMVNKAHLIEQIADLVRNKRINEIRDLRDESDKGGVRVVIEPKKGANTEILLNQLFKHSRLEVSFGMNLVALVDNKPETLSIHDCLDNFINHRREIIKRRTEFDLEKTEKRLHILEGLTIALNNIDAVVALIKASDSVDDARSSLIEKFGLSEAQSNAILDMKLQKLTSLETGKIKSEYDSLLELAKELRAILDSKERMDQIIIDETQELMDKYGDERKSVISDIELDDSSLDLENLIDEHDVVVTVSHSGYIKRIPLNTYRQQNRGGKGVIASTTKEDDFIESVFVTSTHNYILFFSDAGKVYWKKVYEIPEGSRQHRGQHIVNLIEISKDESVSTFIPVKSFDDSKNLALITSKGTIKKTSLSAYSRPRKGGIRAINLDEDDSLVTALLTTGNNQLLVATRNGMAVKFHEEDAREMGRTARGVRAIRLKGDDCVVGMVDGDDDRTVLTITDNGYGKRTKISDYRLINRGGIGVRNIVCSERNGKVVNIKSVTDEDDVMIISQKGIIIRVPCRTISVIGRNTQGVRLMSLKSSDDHVISFARIAYDEDVAEEISHGLDNTDG
ncbi:MAG: DNA gyrase subunit A [Candidatus Woesearchaeota archaeon]